MAQPTLAKVDRLRAYNFRISIRFEVITPCPGRKEMKDLLKADGLARSGQVRFAALRQPASMRESLLAGRQIRLGCADDVLAFLRCERVPCKKMLREIAKELGVSLEDMQRILGR